MKWTNGWELLVTVLMPWPSSTRKENEAMHELLREYVQGFQLPGLKDHVLVKLEL
jgi:hypothetical protein